MQANRDLEMKNYHYHKLQQKDKINRVKFLAKCRSQTTFDEMRMEEEERKKQVCIYLLRLTKLMK